MTIHLLKEMGTPLKTQQHRGMNMNKHRGTNVLFPISWDHFIVPTSFLLRGISYFHFKIVLLCEN